jgi:hypothetical protein
MKKIIICLLFVAIASQYSCKKFLDIVPIDKLTGNNFYQSSADVESNITDMYGQLFDKYTQTNTAGGTGEFRSGEVIAANQSQGSRTFRFDAGLVGGQKKRINFSGTSTGPQPITGDATVNDRYLLSAVNTPNTGQTFTVNGSTHTDWAAGPDGTPNTYRFYYLTRWTEYYKVIQEANILISKLAEGIPSLSADQTKAYIAEAKFIRCYCYFTMVRLYGDVVYYTTPFQKDPLPRANMVSVVSQCIADLEPSKPDLPMAVSDPSLRGVRASRGAIICLLMNMKMWNAGFDPANKTAYYQQTAALGAEIMASNAFRLVQLSEWNTVSKGRSEESLFELYTSVNYTGGSQVYSEAPFGESFIHFPYRLPEYDNRTSPCVFTSAYMNKLYTDTNDGRLATWFDVPFDQNTETFQMKKFAGNTFIDSSNPLNNAIPDATFLIMRYSDAILLRAEALAELGDVPNATIVLNAVRSRALATPYPGPFDPTNIKDAIFWERAKELMGEGSHYFDLVRTKRITSKAYTDNPLTSDKFSRGGWTWPIDASALSNNPYMTLNTYWIGSGIQ